MIKLEDYKAIARKYQGTEACAAIIGLITEIQKLQREITKIANHETR